ncbi:MAG: DUF421 domain-containing protein [Oscillospiraceae bacterium]
MELLKVIITTMVSIAVLFLLTKLIGHRQISQLDLFDYINGITIGSIAAELATELEAPLRPLVAMVLYGLFAVALGKLTARYQRTRKYVNGTPTILLDRGKLYRENMKKAKLELSDFMVMCREAGYFDLSQIQTAVFEYNGKLTILPVPEARPVTPSDLGVAVDAVSIQTEVIMDGRILDANLKRHGLDRTWLKRQLKEQGIASEREVFLGICGANNQLSLYTME